MSKAVIKVTGIQTADDVDRIQQALRDLGVEVIDLRLFPEEENG